MENFCIKITPMVYNENFYDATKGHDSTVSLAFLVFSQFLIRFWYYYYFFKKTKVYESANWERKDKNRRQSQPANNNSTTSTSTTIS